MKVSLTRAVAVRGDFSLSAEGLFGEGIHLVSGDVGSGKSTLALLLAGQLLPASGTVERDGIVSAMMLFQFPEFHVSGRDLLSECRSWGVDPARVLMAAGLEDQKTTNPLDLSRGELKRLVLACVLARDYDLLVLDEPFSSLDCAEKDRLCTALSRRRKGVTVILTHEQAFFPRVDRIWELEGATLHDRGSLPSALALWGHAPPLVKNLLAQGRIPANITRADLREAAWRT